MFQSTWQTGGTTQVDPLRCGKSKSFIYFNSCSLISYFQILHLPKSCCDLWFQSGNLFHFQCVANARLMTQSIKSKSTTSSRLRRFWTNTRFCQKRKLKWTFPFAMVPMPMVRLALKIDVVKMEHAFHMGYKEGDNFLWVCHKLARGESSYGRLWRGLGSALEGY